MKNAYTELFNTPPRGIKRLPRHDDKTLRMLNCKQFFDISNGLVAVRLWQKKETESLCSLKEADDTHVTIVSPCHSATNW